MTFQERQDLFDILYNRGTIAGSEHPISLARTSISPKRPLWELYRGAPSSPGNMTHSAHEVGEQTSWRVVKGVDFLKQDGVAGIAGNVFFDDLGQAKTLCLQLGADLCCGLVCEDERLGKCALREGGGMLVVRDHVGGGSSGSMGGGASGGGATGGSTGAELDHKYVDYHATGRTAAADDFVTRTTGLSGPEKETKKSLNQRYVRYGVRPISVRDSIDNYLSPPSGGRGAVWVKYLKPVEEALAKKVVLLPPGIKLLTNEKVTHVTFRESEVDTVDHEDAAAEPSDVDPTGGPPDARKPRAFFRALRKTAPNDILVFADEGVEFRPDQDIRELVARYLRGSDVAACALTGTDAQFSKRQAFVLTKMDHLSVAESGQIGSSLILARKTPLSLRLARDWLAAALDERIMGRGGGTY